MASRDSAARQGQRPVLPYSRTTDLATARSGELVLLKRLSGDGGWLAASQQPAAHCGHDRQAGHDEQEVDGRDVAERGGQPALPVMTSTPSAIRKPRAVAPSLISPSPSSLDLVSIVVPDETASCRAALICAAVSGCGVWIRQPYGISCRCSRRTAGVVRTVFGAEVPLGRAPNVCIGGLATQLPDWQGCLAGWGHCPRSGTYWAATPGLGAW
jgi:hypothetical protein